MVSTSFDLIVIGAGPGGYVAAIRAAQLGMNVACVEKNALGGTCLNVGCIPSKALLESSELFAKAKHDMKEHGVNIGDLTLDFGKMMERKTKVVKQLTAGIGGLFRKNKVTHLPGTATLTKDRQVIVKSQQGSETYAAKHILIATGSAPIAIPSLPFGERIIDSTGALALPHVPNELIVVGGGYIGLEMGSVYLRLGSKVTIIEALDRIVPGMDAEIGQALHKVLAKQGMEFQLSAKVQKATVTGQRVEVELAETSGAASKLSADYVLVAVGRRPFTEDLGLAEAGIATDDRGRIQINDKWETNLSGVYAIGDVVAGPMLAHKASEEGVAVVETIAGHQGHVNYATIPGVVYTWPEVASVGLSEEDAKKQGIDYKVAKFPFMANGRAISMGDKDGFVKLLADKADDRLIGAHIIGPRASDMIAELVLGMEFSTTAADIALTVHAHPTLSEAIKEAALGLGSGMIHL